MPSNDLGHVRPAPHMYVSMKTGVQSPVRALGRGYLMQVGRTAGMNEFYMTILHSCSLRTYYGHLSELANERIIALIKKYVGEDYDVDGTGYQLNLGLRKESGDLSGKAILDTLILEAGEVIATKDGGYGSGNIDIGTVDMRKRSGEPVGDDYRYWAGKVDFMRHSDYLHSTSFTNYFSDANRDAYLAYLNVPSGAKPPLLSGAATVTGSTVKDVAGRLQGNWYHESIWSSALTGANGVDVAESAALVFFKTLADPTTATLAFALKWDRFAADPIVGKMPALDPKAWEPCGCTTPGDACDDACYLEQKRPSYYVDHLTTGKLNVALDATPGAVSNLDPTQVAPGTTVCYDFKPVTRNTWDRIYFHLASDNVLKVKIYPAQSATAQCASKPTVDMTSGAATYVRGNR